MQAYKAFTGNPDDGLEAPKVSVQDGTCGRMTQAASQAQMKCMVTCAARSADKKASSLTAWHGVAWHGMAMRSQLQATPL